MIEKKNLQDIISKEEELLSVSNDPNIKVNILYNIIVYKHKSQNDNIYIYIKEFITLYIEVVNKKDFGYDSFCISKVLKIINFLDCNKRIALLNYLLSTILREFPEFDIEWVHNNITKAKIDKILSERKILLYPKALLLYSSSKIHTLILVLFFFFFFVFIILLPAPYEFMELFKFMYYDYSNSFIMNHFFNTLMLFSNINNNVIPLNGVGVFVYVLSKVSFVLLIINFVYKRIAEKISLK